MSLMVIQYIIYSETDYLILCWQARRLATNWKPTSTFWTSPRAALSIWLYVAGISRPSVSALLLGPKSTSNRYCFHKDHLKLYVGSNWLTRRADIHLVVTTVFAYHSAHSQKLIKALELQIT